MATSVQAGVPVQVAPVQTVLQAPAVTYSASTTAQPGTQTATLTSDQLTGILNKGGSLMQSAATTGKQQAAQAGLLNSSMGIQAAQNAMVQNAAPIAQQNAAALNAADQFNISNLMNTGQFNAQQLNQAAQFGAQAQNAVNQGNAQFQNAMAQFNVQQQSAADLQAQTQRNQIDLANIEANYKTLMQTNSSAADIYSQAIKSVNDLYLNPDITPEARTAGETRIYQQLQDALEHLNAMSGISNLVTFPSGTGSTGSTTGTTQPSGTAGGNTTGTTGTGGTTGGGTTGTTGAGGTTTSGGGVLNNATEGANMLYDSLGYPTGKKSDGSMATIDEVKTELINKFGFAPGTSLNAVANNIMSRATA